ncbi:cadherin repeat domain-containing protein [Bathymodiolus thermophilus thioautotrophic gill symbiont]|uniref:Cadherin domain-containing protein n=2 Tax=Bathymodiolus thermophilus thioautotrophic gill symbiont TaxID=2360 RepID=A0A8H8XBA4_9GAMM|nr:cadherin repeat domain-containing protein [Bathymodiolus thermophilus thioautotrophic gill symbiont]CAB5499772.1 hypothetical protein THERMOS_1084 [Bathymodiolus thermophilus thioautotrophic gill symbiont]
MNTFNRFIITTLLVLFASQAFATSPTITKIERINVNTILVTLDQGIKPVSHFDVPIEGRFYILLYTSATYYLGSSSISIARTPTAVNPNDNGFATQWQWEEPALTATDNDGLSEITINLNAYSSDFENDIGHSSRDYTSTLNLIWQHDLSITSINTLDTNEGANLEHTLIASDTAATFSIIENTSGLFSLSDTNNNTLTFNGTNTDYESTTKSYTVKIKATTGDGDDKNTEQTITANLVDLNDETPTAITLTGDRTIAENTRTGTELGALSTTDADANDTFTYTSSNTKFTIDNNKLKLNTTLDYENATSLSTTITVTDANSHTFDKIFNFTVGNIDDTAPTNILLSNLNLIKSQPANTLIGTLSATDVDTSTALTFSVDDTTNFKIVNGNELRTNRSTTALGNTININITASDNTNDSAPQPFTIAITTTYIAAPVISQFSVTQGENKGPIISKDGEEVTVSASTGTGTYTWSSNDFSNTSTNKTFVFNPQSANIGTRTITLKVTAGDFSSERVLKLKLVNTYPNGRIDINGNGISDSKESGNSDNELPAGTSKKITSPGSTRILPGIMGEDSGQLTLDQLKQYRVANHLSDYTKDTLATGDIYDYIVEGLRATGDSTQVIIQLATLIPANAVLRQYSLATGWRNFVVDNNNSIQSKTNTSNICTDTDGTWQTGLITGATCLKLTLKDGGENDADGNQANGVVESTVSIATPVVGGNDDNGDSSSSGGGCVYNPNAPARFDTVFILLMTLSAYYLIRRRRRFSY